MVKKVNIATKGTIIYNLKWFNVAMDHQDALHGENRATILAETKAITLFDQIIKNLDQRWQGNDRFIVWRKLLNCYFDWISKSDSNLYLLLQGLNDMPSLRENTDMDKNYNDNQLIIALLKPLFTILLDETKCTKRLKSPRIIQNNAITFSLKKEIS